MLLTVREPLIGGLLEHIRRRRRRRSRADRVERGWRCWNTGATGTPPMRCHLPGRFAGEGPRRRRWSCWAREAMGHILRRAPGSAAKLALSWMRQARARRTG